MPARTTRQEARARILAAFAAQLDPVIPEDESVPLKGATFVDFENQVETLAQAVLPVVLEERGTQNGMHPVSQHNRGQPGISKRIFL